MTKYYNYSFVYCGEHIKVGTAVTDSMVPRDEHKKKEAVQMINQFLKEYAPDAQKADLSTLVRVPEYKLVLMDDTIVLMKQLRKSQRQATQRIWKDFGNIDDMLRLSAPQGR